MHSQVKSSHTHVKDPSCSPCQSWVDLGKHRRYPACTESARVFRMLKLDTTDYGRREPCSPEEKKCNSLTVGEDGIWAAHTLYAGLHLKWTQLHVLTARSPGCLWRTTLCFPQSPEELSGSSGLRWFEWHTSQNGYGSTGDRGLWGDGWLLSACSLKTGQDYHQELGTVCKTVLNIHYIFKQDQTFCWE